MILVLPFVQVHASASHHLTQGETFGSPICFISVSGKDRFAVHSRPLEGYAKGSLFLVDFKTDTGLDNGPEEGW